MVSTQLSIFDIDFISREKVTENKELDTKMPKSDTKKTVLDTKIDESYTKIINKSYKPKIDKTKKPLELTPEQQNFLTRNEVMKGENLQRIILQSCGWMAIEGSYENIFSTKYINTEGQTEFVLEQKTSVLPKDKILYHKTDFEINTIQKQKLQEVKQKYQGQIKRIIHRHGDENILVELGNKLLDIIARGWVLEFTKTTHVDCLKDEVIEDFTVQNVQNVGNLVKVGDYVQAFIGKELMEGKITRTYGIANEILNISFKRNGVGTCTAIPRFMVQEIIFKDGGK
ncbi:hypothetical protein KYB31_15590 [Clostridium felsineum]|uniref:hypothetical protein n=1 Tax=Clostridium felsineum TaxID=36839 RepID=UPI00214DE27E|nr:hypothetical protein [Clostridium felsineum]MCR3760400.1 hypothetical protein [Clostridium felsineum]